MYKILDHLLGRFWLGTRKTSLEQQDAAPDAARRAMLACGVAAVAVAATGVGLSTPAEAHSRRWRRRRYYRRAYDPYYYPAYHPGYYGWPGYYWGGPRFIVSF